MSLLDRLPDCIATYVVPLDVEGLAVEDAFYKARCVLSKQPINWQMYESMKGQFSTRLSGYKGRFKEYFERRLEELGQKEKLDLGYFNSE